MKNVEASFQLIAECNCPNEECDELINLFDFDELTDDGHIHKLLMDETNNGHWGEARNFNHEIECPECKTKFIVKNINY